MNGTVREMSDALIDQVLAAVNTHVAADADEEQSIATLITEVDRIRSAGGNPFDQRDDVVHITGSAIVVGPRGTVLLEHKRLGMWLQQEVMLIKVNLRGMQHFVRHGKKPALMCDLPMGDLGLFMLMFIKGAWAYTSRPSVLG